METPYDMNSKQNAPLVLLSGGEVVGRLDTDATERLLRSLFMSSAVPLLYKKEAEQLLFYVQDSPRFVSALQVLVARDKRRGKTFWATFQEGYENASPTLSGNFFSSLVGVFKGWNVNRGDKKVKQFESNLEAAEKAGDSQAMLKWSNKLTEQQQRQARREKNFTGWHDSHNISSWADNALTKKHTAAGSLLLRRGGSSLSTSLLPISNPGGGMDIRRTALGQGRLNTGENNTTTNNNESGSSFESPSGGGTDWGALTAAAFSAAGNITSAALQSSGGNQLASAGGVSSGSVPGAIASGVGGLVPHLGLPAPAQQGLQAAALATQNVTQALTATPSAPVGWSPTYGAGAYSAPAVQQAGFSAKTLGLTAGAVALVAGITYFIKKSPRTLGGSDEAKTLQGSPEKSAPTLPGMVAYTAPSPGLYTTSNNKTITRKITKSLPLKTTQRRLKSGTKFAVYIPKAGHTKKQKKQQALRLLNP